MEAATIGPPATQQDPKKKGRYSEIIHMRIEAETKAELYSFAQSVGLDVSDVIRDAIRVVVSKKSLMSGYIRALETHLNQ